MAPIHSFLHHKNVFSPRQLIQDAASLKRDVMLYIISQTQEFLERLRDLDITGPFSQVYDDGKSLNALVCWGLWLAHIPTENENTLFGTEKHMEGGEEAQKTKAVPKQYTEIKFCNSPRPPGSWKLVEIFVNCIWNWRRCGLYVVYMVHVVYKIKLKCDFFSPPEFH